MDENSYEELSKKSRWEIFKQVWNRKKAPPKDDKFTAEEITSGKDLRRRDFDNAFFGKAGPPKKEPTPKTDLKEEDAEEKSGQAMRESLERIRANLEEIEKRLGQGTGKASDPDMREVGAKIREIKDDLSLREGQTSLLCESAKLKVLDLYGRWQRDEITALELVEEFKALGIF
jgi:hypothetical protein